MLVIEREIRLDIPEYLVKKLIRFWSVFQVVSNQNCKFWTNQYVRKSQLAHARHKHGCSHLFDHTFEFCNILRTARTNGHSLTLKRLKFCLCNGQLCQSVLSSFKQLQEDWKKEREREIRFRQNNFWATFFNCLSRVFFVNDSELSARS